MGTHPIFESDFDCLTDRKHVSLESSRYLVRSLLVRRRQCDEKGTQARSRRPSRRRIGPECHLAQVGRWPAHRGVQLRRQGDGSLNRVGLTRATIYYLHPLLDSIIPSPSTTTSPLYSLII